MTTAQLPTVRVAGVPEHFNWPWHIGIDRGLFQSAGVTVEWTDVKAGTGALINGLKAGDFDLIVALTEGLIADIALGSNLLLISSYVDSPLVWAISAGGKQTQYNSLEDIKGSTVAVSRFTSGSHLMACVLASQRGWRQDDLSFVVKGPFDKLRESVNDGSASSFMWETFMTKPFHDAGEVKRIGEIVTPWPCFLIASTKPIIDSQLDVIQRVLVGIREACRIFHSDPSIPSAIAAHFAFRLEDAQAWYLAVRITASPSIAVSSIEKTLTALREAAILPSAAPTSLSPEQFVDARLLAIRTDIATMKLYNRPELIIALHNNLRHNKLHRGSLPYTALLPFDQNYYNPTAALDTLAKLTVLERGMAVLNIGSGLGGPSRYLAGKYGAHVTAVELQQDLHTNAVELTDRCSHSMTGTVQHVGADALKLLPLLQSSSFELIFSLLTILHLTDSARAPLFSQSFRILKPGGRQYIEDWYAAAPLSPAELTALEEQVYCKYLPSKPDYLTQLHSAGFVLDIVEDLTEEWTSWVRGRRDRWVEGKDRWIMIHGDDLYHRLLEFYQVIVRLMEGGHVGGIRIVAKKAAA